MAKQGASTGVFMPAGGWWLERYTGDIGDGSCNSISISLGYEPSQVHTVHLFDRPGGMLVFGILPLTRELLFVVTEEIVKKLRTAVVERELAKVDWDFEYSAAFVDDILDTAIAAESWNVEFMQRIFPGLGPDPGQVFHSDRLGYYLFIQDGRLVAYESSDGLSKWGKHFNELNPRMVNCWLGEGFILHGDQKRAVDYVNLQAEAWATIPTHLWKNGAPGYHRKDGSIDYFLLGVDAGERPVSHSEFILRIGSKRESTFSACEGEVEYEFEGKRYRFVDKQLAAVSG